jgi:Ca2+-binding RTX toxin-like protein
MTKITGTNKSETLTDKTRDQTTVIYGYGGNDTLNGGINSDDLLGGEGNDRLFGGDGDDWLYGEAGSDFHNGGTGYDGASYYNSTRSITVSLDGSLKATGDAIGDTFSSVEKLRGSNTASNTLAGNSLGNNLIGGRLADTLFGRSGDDWLVGGRGPDILHGSSGTDGASYFSSESPVRVSLDGSIKGSADARGDTFVSIEKLEGSNFKRGGGDWLAGNASQNIILGLDGEDRLYGRGGNDELYGGNGSDLLLGEAGNDDLFGGNGDDVLNGGEGQDEAVYLFSTTAVVAALDGTRTGRGDALYDIYISIEDLTGSDRGADTLVGNELSNQIYGAGGNDKLYGRAGNDNLQGGSGADRLDGGDGDKDTASYYFSTGVTGSLDGSLTATGEAVGDTFFFIEQVEGSKTGNDRLGGDARDNSLYGQGGNDILYGRDGNDSLQGGAGADRLYGGSGADFATYNGATKGFKLALDGSFAATGDAAGDTFSSIENIAGSEVGNDFLRGNALDNELHGQGGNDILQGMDGNDKLAGDNGSDTLTGGVGNDVFWFFFVNGGTDNITDFTTGDQIELKTASFKALGIGTLAPEQFINGAGHAAVTDLVRVMFDTDDNTLWYDADGSGAAAAVKIATFTNGYQGLMASDFILSA